jgi:hypothetical protein
MQFRMNFKFNYSLWVIFIFLCIVFQALFVECSIFKKLPHSVLNSSIIQFVGNDHHVFRKLQVQPSSQPSRQPTSAPSGQPSPQPSRQPSVQPTSQPSRQPSSVPTQPSYFTCSGSMKQVVVPSWAGIVIVDMAGASGGASGVGIPGKGARVISKISVPSGSVMHITVGCQGAIAPDHGCGTCMADGGFGGGGAGSFDSSAGGGASDIRIGGTSFSSRVIVAGGGGGTYLYVCNGVTPQGGDGGAPIGGNGVSTGGCAAPGAGGTLTAGGAGPGLLM